MKFLILLIFCTTSNVYAFTAKTLKANIRTLSCLPTNASSAGVSSSSNFGNTYSSCSSFTCNSGYTVSGSTCIAAAVYNVVCDTQLGGKICTSSENYGAGAINSTSTNYDGFSFGQKLNCPTGVINSFGKTSSTTYSYTTWIGTTYTYIDNIVSPSISSFYESCSGANNSCETYSGAVGNFYVSKARFISLGCTNVP